MANVAPQSHDTIQAGPRPLLAARVHGLAQRRTCIHTVQDAMAFTLLISSYNPCGLHVKLQKFRIAEKTAVVLNEVQGG